MPSTITAEKAALRKSIKEIYLSEAQRRESDAILLERFLSLPQVECASTLLLYYGVAPEPDTARLFAPLSSRGKRLALPRCLPGGNMEARLYQGSCRLRSGPYDIPEPDESCPVLSPDQLSLILVPALCCDARGSRLGHGGGYYDRFLSSYSGLTVALCRDRLLLPSLPTESHDCSVDMVLTETRCLSFFPKEKSGATAPPLM